MARAIRIHARDNVATMAGAVAPGETVAVSGAGEERVVVAAEAIPQAHKMALAAFGEGESVIKYGEAIGRTTTAVALGAWIHSHNLRAVRGRKGRVP